MDLINKGFNLVGNLVELSEKQVHDLKDRCVNAVGEFPNFGVFSGQTLIFYTPDFKMEKEEGLQIKTILLNGPNQDSPLFSFDQYQHHITIYEKDNKVMVGERINSPGTVYIKGTYDAKCFVIAFDERAFNPQLFSRFRAFADDIIGPIQN